MGHLCFQESKKDCFQPKFAFMWHCSTLDKLSMTELMNAACSKEGGCQESSLMGKMVPVNRTLHI